MFLFWLLLSLCLLGSVRAYVVLSRKTARIRSQSDTCSLAVFLGSGGHTSEAILLLETLDFKRYTPRVYLISEGDTLSAQKAIALESSRQTSDKDYRIIVLPRARRVHQSFLSAPPTFIKSLLFSFIEVSLRPALRRQPFADVMLLNGPGTCVPVCIAAYINKIIGLPSPRTIYVESFARVRSLSLSAKLLRPFVDRFVVQWPHVLKDGKRGECRGWLI